MKTAIIFLLIGYQKIISPFLHQLIGQQQVCRYEISCSEYAKAVVKKYGVLRGGLRAMNRLLHCQPFSKAYVNL